jgi:hypothetical protein
MMASEPFLDGKYASSLCGMVIALHSLVSSHYHIIRAILNSLFCVVKAELTKVEESRTDFSG